VKKIKIDFELNTKEEIDDFHEMVFRQFNVIMEQGFQGGLGRAKLMLKLYEKICVHKSQWKENMKSFQMIIDQMDGVNIKPKMKMPTSKTSKKKSKKKVAKKKSKKK